MHQRMKGLNVMSNRRTGDQSRSGRCGRARPRLVGGLAGAATLALAACGGTGGSAAAPDSIELLTTVPATTAAPTTAAPTTVAPTTAAPDSVAVTDGGSAAAATSAGTGGDPSCLVGSWVITEEEMNAYYEVLAANLGPADLDLDLGFDMDIVGEVTLDLDGSDYEYVADFDVFLAVAGLEGEGTSSGSVSGTYTADGGVIATETVSSDLTVTIDVGGMPMDGGDLSNGLLTDLPISGGPYGCDGPTLSFQAGFDPSIRHDVVLTAR